MNRIKSINNQIYLSVVALLVILMVGVGITYSWIEGGSTFRLATVGDDSVKTAEVPEIIKDRVTLAPGGTYSALDLADAYDKNVNEKLDNDDVQGLYFAPVHSVDGKKFIFPIEFDSDGKAVKFRDANTNDIGTKFIKFSFDYKATKNSYLAFDSLPGVIARYSDGQQINDKTALSAFRFMISKTPTDGVPETHIFCPGDEARTTDVVTSSSFDTNVSPPTSPVTASIFNDKVVDNASNNRLFNLSADEEGKIEIAIWLDAADPYLTDEAVESILGRSVELSMDLVVEEPKVKVTFDARTFDSNGSPLDNFDGGNIEVGSKTADGEPLSVYFVKGAEITANALIKDESKFKFDGWYTDSSFSPDSKDYAAANLANRYADSEITYYAKFVEKSKYTINVSQTTVPANVGVGGTVSINGNGTSCTDYEGTTITLTAIPANDTFEFVGWFKNDAAAGTVSPMDVTIKEDRDGDTYVAKFVKKYTVDFKVRTDNDVDNTSGGKVEIVNGDNTTTASAAVSVTVPYGSEITLKRNTTTSGYVYNGITRLSDSSTVADSNTDSVVVTVDGPETYYAEFITQPAKTTTIYFESRDGFSKYYAWIYNKSDESINYSDTDWPGKEATLDSKTGLYKCTFDTNDSGSFCVIVNNGSGTQYPGSGQAGLEGTIGGTYVFRANNQLVETDPLGNYTYYYVVKSDWNNYTVQYNNKWKSGAYTDTWPGPINMTNTGYTYNGNKIWSVTFKYNDIFYNVAFKTMNGNTQINYSEVYAGGGIGKYDLENKMYDATSAKWINFTHD